MRRSRNKVEKAISHDIAWIKRDKSATPFKDKIKRAHIKHPKRELNAVLEESDVQ